MINITGFESQVERLREQESKSRNVEQVLLALDEAIEFIGSEAPNILIATEQYKDLNHLKEYLKANFKVDASSYISAKIGLKAVLSNLKYREQNAL